MEKVINSYHPLEFESNQESNLELEPKLYISHMDCLLTARVKSFYNSKPRRRVVEIFGESELESVFEARRSAFVDLIEAVEIITNDCIVARYSGWHLLMFSQFITEGGLRADRLPIRGHIRKISTHFMIHGSIGSDLAMPPFRDNHCWKYGWKWDRSRVIRTCSHSLLKVEWGNERTLGYNYEVEWGKLEVTTYGYKCQSDKLAKQELQLAW